MRTKSLLKMAMLVVCVVLPMVGCGSSKSSSQSISQSSTPSSETQKKIKELQDEAALVEAQSKLDAAKRKAEAEVASVVMDVPCFQPDDEDWYTGTVSRRRPVNSTNTLATACLRAARQNLQQKIKGALKQVTRDYFDQMDVNEGSTEASHIESAADYIVDQFMNDMQETCRKISQPDAQGMVTMYIGVRISKKALVEKMVTGLSRDKQVQMRFDEKVFREDAFKVFSQDRQQSYDDYKSTKE